MTTRSKVAVVRTSPKTVQADYSRLMDLAGIREALPVGPEVSLRINISWHVYMPACSTTPWQLDAVIHKLLETGHAREKIYAAQNRTVVVDCRVGAVNNNLQPVLDRNGIEIQYLNEKPTKWVKYEPKAKMTVLNDVFPKGILVPERLIGSNVIHMPTMKTHVFTTTTGAMKNAFGGLLNTRRHYTHSWIHETLVDLLAIQKEIHAGLFAIMDGTTAGNGPGPRTMFPVVKNVMLASADQVAIDAVSAKMMGFDPMSLDYIRLAHEDGLGIGDPRQIEIVGDVDAAKENWNFRVGKNLVRVGGGDLIWFGPLKRFQKLFFHTPLVNGFILASDVYHDFYRWPLVDRRVFERWCETTAWGQMFLRYADSGPQGAPIDALVPPLDTTVPTSSRIH